MIDRTVLLTLTLLLLTSACRNPDVREDAIVQPPDTAVVDAPLYDPAELPRDDEAGPAQQADQLAARRTIMRDPLVVEAQVLMVEDTVRVTAVLAEGGIADAPLKAHQFVITAFRNLERPAMVPGVDPLGPSRFTYTVTVRDEAGETVFAGIKEPQDREIRRQ